jgi:hypothetical protein
MVSYADSQSPYPNTSKESDENQRVVDNVAGGNEIDSINVSSD